MSIGEQIKQAREEKNYSQEELAAKLDVSRQAISKWENDTAVPNGTNREMLNQILGLSLTVIDDEESTKRNNIIGISGWVLAGMLALCLIISLIYIKTRLPIVNDNNPKAELQRKEIEVSQKILDINAEEILLANTYIGTDEAGNASGATICLICKKTLSNDLEEMIYETAASLIAVDRNNINIVVEVNYSPDGDANSEIEQDAADNDSVTYVY